MKIVEHIDVDPKKCGGKPCIAGTRIRVWDIHVWHDLRGQSPAEIIAAYPQLSLSDVHAALAYYLDHREEIERQAQEDEDFVSQMRAAAGPSKLDQFRDKDVQSDSASS
jgi:uncharacterized protein (DUF433 family)